MATILNIGLLTSLNFDTEVHTLTLEGVKQAIQDAGLLIEGDIKVLNSNTEPTAVLTVYSMVEIEGASIYPEIYDLSVRLMQDCVASYNVESQKGKLIGRHAEQWGEFDSKYFLI